MIIVILITIGDVWWEYYNVLKTILKKLTDVLTVN